MPHVKRGRTWQLFAFIVLLFVAVWVYLMMQIWIDIMHLQQLGANTSDDWSTFPTEALQVFLTVVSLAIFVLPFWFLEHRRQRAARGKAKLSSHQPEADALALELPTTLHWKISRQIGLYLWGFAAGFLAIIIIGGILQMLLSGESWRASDWEFLPFLAVFLFVFTSLIYLLMAFFANHRLVIAETGITHTHLGRTQTVHWPEARLFIHLISGWYELSSDNAIVRWDKPSPTFPFNKTNASPEAIDALHMLIAARTGLPLYEL